MDYPPHASQPLNEYNSAFLASMAFPILAVIALVNRGRVKWTDKTVSIFQLFLNFLKQIEAFRDDYAFTCSYISTKSNPADALSRRALGPTAQSPVPDEPMNIIKLLPVCGELTGKMLLVIRIILSPIIKC